MTVATHTVVFKHNSESTQLLRLLVQGYPRKKYGMFYPPLVTHLNYFNPSYNLFRYFLVAVQYLL